VVRILIPALALLFGSMVMTAILGREGLFAAASRALVRRCDSARALLLRVCGICALLAAAVTNDTVCVFVTPVVTRLCHQLRVVLAPHPHERFIHSFILYACNWWRMLQQSFLCFSDPSEPISRADLICPTCRFCSRSPHRPTLAVRSLQLEIRKT
jgi:hypothetical protein